MYIHTHLRTHTHACIQNIVYGHRRDTRALHMCTRALYMFTRALYMCTRALHMCTRALYMFTRALYMCTHARDVDIEEIHALYTCLFYVHRLWVIE